MHTNNAGNVEKIIHRKNAKLMARNDFTIQKTNLVFSAIRIDQAHVQNNACIKSDGRAIGLTDNSGALLRWIGAGHEVAALIKDFEDAH